VLAQLVRVNCIDNRATETPGFSRAGGHWLFSQLPEDVAVFLGDAGGGFKHALGRGIVGGKQDPMVGLDGEHGIAWFQMKAVGHVFRKRGADGSPDLAQRVTARVIPRARLPR